MNRDCTIGVLVPTNGATPTTPPEARPIGRAALVLAKRGIDVIFGDAAKNDCMSGHRAIADGWETVTDIPVNAVHDRYPSQLRSKQWMTIQQGLVGIPMGNPIGFTMFCRDKLLCQSRLEQQGIRMPAVEDQSDQFESRIHEWKNAFFKPRFGALGIGVRHVRPGDLLSPHCQGVIPNAPDPAILQQAVPPPAGWAGRSIRVLIQRTAENGWFHGVPVVRQSRNDFVVNAARGADIAAGTQTLSPTMLRTISIEVERVCEALEHIEEAHNMVEAGLDLVIDNNEGVWLIEVNSRPRGRLEFLACVQPEAYQDLHVVVCARPIEVLANRT
jgi:glutathione synthase/RimK-type ligase-like ATP-grasp enzyme